MWHVKIITNLVSRSSTAVISYSRYAPAWVGREIEDGLHYLSFCFGTCSDAIACVLKSVRFGLVSVNDTVYTRNEFEKLNPDDIETTAPVFDDVKNDIDFVLEDLE